METILREKLQKHFGYKSFRPLQEDIIKDVLLGKDRVVLMPTGGGKSICFQLPSVILEGLTLVISPLIALMKDQVQSLKANGIEAVFLNSTQNESEKSKIKDKINSNKVDLLYVAPETIFSQGFIDYIKTLNISLIAIDEAHCVSSWGHDFRPKYQQLHILKEEFPETPTLALTATADRAVRSDIGDLLGMRDSKTFISSFDRPNLSLAVLPGQKKWEQIIGIVKKYDTKSGIIYCSSRKATESVAEKLIESGVNAAYYHAGLPNERRELVQDEFIEGSIDVICATVAFGMGIDKSDIRYVIHHNMPSNLESYYQEIGRAGRDGEPAETILFYSYRDVQTQMGFIEKTANEKYKNIQIAKLNRMQEYAEAQICRRKILLSYFSETQPEDCGNCDVCKNPPKYFDGKILAQKALSAIVRTSENIGVTTLVEILRGLQSDTIRQNSYNQIKTFGVGRDTTNFAWLLYIQQFVQQGIVEIDYKEHSNLKLNDFSKKVLNGDVDIKLVNYDVIKQRQEEQKKVVKKAKITQLPADESLFEHLRSLRNRIAKEKDTPAFVIFSNESIKDMSTQKPSTRDEFLNMHGVGEHKADLYSDMFIKAIAEYQSGKTNGDTFKATLELFKKGKSIDEIATERQLQTTTIFSHLAKFIDTNENVNITDLISEEELNDVRNAKKELKITDKLRPYYNYFNEKLSYGKIRVALTYLENNE